MERQRRIFIIADDFGIGPKTSEAILELAELGRLTGTVLMVNSPYAEAAVRSWQASKMPIDLGWHPCLTQDPPTAPIKDVSSLVNPQGVMWPLGTFLKRLMAGKISSRHIAVELQAQLNKYTELVGTTPKIVNAHQHISVFPGVRRPFLELIKVLPPTTYIRRVREPWKMLRAIPGAKIKRAVLNFWGRKQGKSLDRMGFIGNRWLAGVTDPKWVEDANFFERWCQKIPGDLAELCCHPGHHDVTLIGRDCAADNEWLQRRVREYHLIRDDRFLKSIQGQGWTVTAPSEIARLVTPKIDPTDDSDTKLHETSHAT